MTKNNIHNYMCMALPLFTTLWILFSLLSLYVSYFYYCPMVVSFWLDIAFGVAYLLTMDSTDRKDIRVR